jgi:hypothetical protein
MSHAMLPRIFTMWSNNFSSAWSRYISKNVDKGILKIFHSIFLQNSFERVTESHSFWNQIPSLNLEWFKRVLKYFCNSWEALKLFRTYHIVCSYTCGWIFKLTSACISGIWKKINTKKFNRKERNKIIILIKLINWKERKEKKK